MPSIHVKRKQYEIIKTLLEDETHSTYLTKKDDKNYIVKSYVTFNVFSYAIEQHKKLKKCGIKSPKLLKVDKVRLTILFEYIEGEDMLSVLSKQDISDEVFDKLFIMYRFARFSKIDLNYLPENYVFYKNELYYMSTEIGPQMTNKNLENYGIRYWVYTFECGEHLEEKGYVVDKSRLLPRAVANKKIVLLSIMRW